MYSGAEQTSGQPPGLFQRLTEVWADISTQGWVVSNPQMARLQSLSTGNKVVAGSLVLALISMFLPWYGWSYGAYGATTSGFHNFGLLYFLFWLITAAFWSIRAFDLPVELPGLPLVDWQLYIIGGFVMLCSGLLYYVNVPSGSITAGVASVHWGVSFGWWIALIAAAGVIAGGWLSRPGIETSTFRATAFSGVPGGSPAAATTSPSQPTADPRPETTPEVESGEI